MENETRIDLLKTAVLDLLEDLSKTQKGLTEIQGFLCGPNADAFNTEARLATTEAILHDARSRLVRAEIQLQDAARRRDLQGVRREIFENKADVFRWLAGSLVIVCIGGVIFMSSIVGNISSTSPAPLAPIIINVR